GNHFKSIYMPSKNGEFGGFFKILNSVALEIIFAKKMWVKESPSRSDPIFAFTDERTDSSASRRQSLSPARDRK
ncbi:MAG: hypothetical protein JWQ35_2170, partial [Bacteriovoracaceae bacterium]|nr:hypothetical protein [Bacteriovoracaceae bacterium]